MVDGLLDQLQVTRYAIYVMDYGAPVGWRLALKHPERITALIVQNGNAYDEGLREFWDPIKKYWADSSEDSRNALRKLFTLETTKFQYTDGVSDTSPKSRQITGPMTNRFLTALATMISNSTSSMITERISTLSESAGVPAQASAADTNRLGEKRLYLPGRRRSPL